jgi:hypothetical protein
MSSLFILIAASVLAFLVILFLPFYFSMIRPASKRRRLEESGKPGTGLIEEVRDTGATINRNIQIRLTLEIRPADGSPSFEAEATALVPRLDPSRYRPGGQVAVKYDPVTKTAAVDTRIH